jgi:hypothetical protein
LGGVIAPAIIAELTVTVSPGEHREVGEKDESVTLYEYVVVMVGEAENVGEVADVIRPLHIPSEYH